MNILFWIINSFLILNGFFRSPSEEGLMKLPGIGKVTAEKIMAVGKLRFDKD